MELCINNTKFTVSRFDNESNKVFNERVEFIKKVFNDTKNIKEAINLSKIWLNYTYNKCRYQPNIFYKLKKYL